MSTSPSLSDAQLPPPTQEAESLLSSIVYDMSQQVQRAMETMLKMINEIDHNSVGIVEDIEKFKIAALERKKALEAEKEHVQKAAYTILDMLNNRE